MGAPNDQSTRAGQHARRALQLLVLLFAVAGLAGSVAYVATVVGDAEWPLKAIGGLAMALLWLKLIWYMVKELRGESLFDD